MEPRSAWKLSTLAVLACLAGTACALENWIEDSERFPGWKGEIPMATSQQAHVETMTVGELGKVSGFTPLCCHIPLISPPPCRLAGSVEWPGGAAVLGSPRIPFPRSSHR